MKLKDDTFARMNAKSYVLCSKHVHIISRYIYNMGYVEREGTDTYIYLLDVRISRSRGKDHIRRREKDFGESKMRER